MAINGGATATTGATRGSQQPAPPVGAPTASTIPSLSPGGSGAGRWGLATPPPPPAPPVGDPTAPNNDGLLQELMAAFPWLSQVGFTPEFFQNLVAESAGPDEVMVKLRQQPQYKIRFPGLWREDGSIRMNEAQYLQTEVNYRQVLSQYGFKDSYTTAGSLKGFFDSEMDANELGQRLDTYKKIEVSSQSQKDAFYVYAGVRLSTDDLYEAAVDPGKADELVRKYNEGVAKSPLDYATWISRATELGLERVANDLTSMQSQGLATGTAIQQVLRTDGTFAQQMMDALYQAGGRTLNLSELLTSFQLSAIGAAASGNGLVLPTKERAQQLVAAGIDQAKALEGYGQLAQFGNLYREAVRRTGAGNFTQTDFEDATFLNDAADQSRLAAGLAREEAAGARTGTFQVQQDRLGRFTQSGVRAGLS